MIERAGAGDPADREEFARCYAPVVRSFFCARWKLPSDHQDVEDAVQEVFVRCFREEGPLTRADSSRPAGFRGYLYGVARNVAADAERRAASRREVTADSEVRLRAIERSEAALSKVLDRAWASLMLEETARLLAERATSDRRAAAQTALRLRMHEGLKAAAVAERMSLDVKVVYELIREAKDQYRATFLEVMAAHHPELGEAELMARCRELAADL